VKFAITRMDPMLQPFIWKPYIWHRSYSGVHYLTVQWLYWQIGAYWRNGTSPSSDASK
jgi:hypothetical protein